MACDQVGCDKLTEIKTTRLEKIIYLDAAIDFSSPGNRIYNRGR